MSIASELSTLIDNKAAIKTAISAKSPTIPPTDVLSQWPAAIASIPSGGGEYDGQNHKFVIDLNLINGLKFATNTGFNVDMTIDWGDGTSSTHAIWSTTVEHTYSQKGIYIIEFKPVNGGNWGVIAGGQFVANTYYNCITDVFCGTGFNFGYITAPIANIHFNKNGQNNVNLVEGANYIGKCIIKSNSLQFQRGGAYTVEATSSITQITGYRWGAMKFRFIRFNASVLSLKEYGFCSVNGSLLQRIEVDKLVAAAGANMHYCFAGHSQLKYIPDDIDFTESTDNANMFTSCTALLRLPKNFKASYSVSFEPCTGVKDKNSVATFENGIITDGLVHNINTCPNSGQTITFNSQIKALFDATKQAAVEAALNAKNWSLAW